MQTNALPSKAYRPGKPFGAQALRSLLQVADVFSTIGEGLRHAREYHDLTQRGMPPRDAVRKVFNTMGR